MPQYVDQAVIRDIPFARFWGDESPPDMEARLADAKKQLEALSPNERTTANDYPGISGGGENGASGAGLLVGWTAAGDRPEFRAKLGSNIDLCIKSWKVLLPRIAKVIMARRIEYPGALYHVLSIDNGYQDLLISDRDHRLFLEMDRAGNAISGIENTNQGFNPC